MTYEKIAINPYFVDKTTVLEEIILLAENYNNYICITRPRRFGKTVIANMLSAFLMKGQDGERLFRSLSIRTSDIYRQYLNQCQVIHISFNELPRKCTGYEQYIESIENRLISDLIKEYPQIEIDEDDSLWSILFTICVETGEQFVFVLDEWDYVFHQNFMTDNDKKKYLSFL